MKIYTRTGDLGETSLFGPGRLSKAALRVSAYGDVDEVNAHLGAAIANSAPGDDWVEPLVSVQRVLFGIGGEVATTDRAAMEKLRARVGAEEVQALEHGIDEMEASLPPLKNFVLPGGSPVSATLHVARTVCRRAERSLVALSKAEELRPEILQYMNRLSDYLFVAARYAAKAAGASETLW